MSNPLPAHSEPEREPEDLSFLGPGHPNYDVIVRGRRVPMLHARMGDGGRVLVVFDQRLAVDLSVAEAEKVIPWVADVMENVMDPRCGRTFNRMVEITKVDGEEPLDDE